MIVIYCLLTLFATAFLVILMHDLPVIFRRRKPKIKPVRRCDVTSRVNEILAARAHHREFLEALAREFVALHGYPYGSDEADELMHVVFDGQDYEQTMQRIMSWKKRANPWEMK